MSDDTVDMVSKALRRAWSLGQVYWQQADSQYTSQHRKSDETQGKFEALIEETRAALSQPAPQGVAGMMHLVEKYASDTADFVLVGSPVSSCEPIEQAITAVATERDTLRERVAELEKDAERYQFWRNRWGDEQFLSTLAGTIRQLSDPLIRGDYNNLDIVSDAAIAASKEIP